MPSQYEAVIGLEVHVQLATASKIFCSCQARLPEGVSVNEEPPNLHLCPVCAGHPGTLPVLNKRVVEYALKIGTAVGAKIRNKSLFARKHYFYPDLPKGYQISQYDQPLCEGGVLEIEVDSKQGVYKKIELERIHLEEDAGKNIHMPEFSLVNLNRAGIPLIEIVSTPQMRSPEEAGAYLRALHQLVMYLGICEGNLQEGHFRCDGNISVRPFGETKLGSKVEIKNVNSFKFIEKALAFEFQRQVECLKSGKMIFQQTRTFDASKGKTIVMRSKEQAQEYRYFPEPDLLTLEVSDQWLEEVRQKLPELPWGKKKRFQSQFGLNRYDASVLTASQEMAEFFEKSASVLEKKSLGNQKAYKVLSNFLTGEIARLLNEAALKLHKTKIKPLHLAEIVKCFIQGEISSTAAKQVLAEVWNTGEAVDVVLEKKNLKQVSDTKELQVLVQAVLKDFPKQVEQFRAGKEKLLGFFIGQGMKRSQGKAHPELLKKLFLEKL